MTERQNGKQQEPLPATEGSSKPEFITRRIGARKDLLHFVEGIIGFQVYEELGKNPQGWIEELNIIHAMLTGENLVAGIGINQPPKEKPGFQKLGDNVFLYRGNIPKLRGVWLSEETTRYDLQSGKEIPHTQWTHYQMGSYGTLRINSEFADIPPENFLPENFEPKSQLVKNDRRPIFTFTVRRGAETITVYAKGAFIATSYLYHPPSYRLTSLVRTRKTTSKEEMERFLRLGQQGIKVPPVLGYYETPVEEFLFLQKVEGGSPLDFLESQRQTIIEQDAQILAALCLLGYFKPGFEDFDDKVFDGQNLYLIDTDEIVDLYSQYGMAPSDFKELLLNPTGVKALDEFRETQRLIFKKALKDVLFGSKKTLTPTPEDQALYIASFFRKIGWPKPTEAQIRELTTFPEDYLTLEQYIGMMTEE